MFHYEFGNEDIRDMNSPSTAHGSRSSIVSLSTLAPPSAARSWHTAPHPYLPLAATSSSDKTVRIYSLRDFRLHSTVSGGHKRSIRASAWKPNTSSTGSSVLATGSFDSSAGIWRRYDDNVPGIKEQNFTSDADAEEDDEWRFAVLLDGHESEIKSLAWSASGQFLATCARDKSVWIWEEMEDDNFEVVGVIQEHDGDVKCVTWHPTEELLVSGSYDDTIRLYKEDLDEWTCICTISAHDATVWSVDFEGEESPCLIDSLDDRISEEQKKAWRERREASGPRFLSCSDDLSVRIWRRAPADRPDAPTGQGTMPSIFRNNSIEEKWVEESRLPQRHERSIYSVAWSKKTGLVASTGSDGKVVVYRERWRQRESEGTALTPGGNTIAEDKHGVNCGAKEPGEATEWMVVAEIDGAHDVYEVNHVCWSQRWDKGRRRDDEEMILTTGDDGETKAWILD